MASRMLSSLTHADLLKRLDLFLINIDRQHFLFLEFIRMVRTPFDDLEAFIFVQLDFGRDKEYFWEEVLLFEDLVVIGLFEGFEFLSVDHVFHFGLNDLSICTHGMANI